MQEMINSDLPMTKEEMESLDKLMFGGYKTFIEKVMNVLKEELIYLHGRIDQVEINQHESNTAMTTGLKMIANGQMDIAKALREQTASGKEIADKQRKWAFALASKDNIKEEQSATDPLFDCCSKNLAEQRNWVNLVKGQIALIVEKTKMPEGSIYNHLYAGMKSHDGYDVEKLWKNYAKSKGTTKLDMFATSDALRLSFEKGVYRLYISKGIIRDNNDDMLVNNVIETVCTNQAGKKTDAVYSTAKARQIPKEIREAMEKAMKHKCSPRDYADAYDRFSKTSGINLDELVEDTKSQFGLKICSKAFAISLDPRINRQFLRSLRSVA